MQKKRCDLMVLNGPSAIDARDNSVEILDHSGGILATIQGTKEEVAQGIFQWIQQRLIEPQGLAG